MFQVGLELLFICFEVFVQIIFYSGYAEGKIIDVEPKCSRFDYEEKLLEKMVRLEHKTELMMESFKEISTQVKADLDAMKAGWETIKQLSEKLETLKQTSIQNITEELTSFRQKSTQTIAEIKETPSKPSYAFSAYWLSTTDPSAGDDLIFTRTVLDNEGVYNNKTGKFTVPVNGIYMISATLCAAHVRYAYVTFLAGETPISRMLTGDDTYRTCSSGSATAKLQKGTDVVLRLHRRGTSNTFYQTEVEAINSFSGHLIQSS